MSEYGYVASVKEIEYAVIHSSLADAEFVNVLF